MKTFRIAFLHYLLPFTLLGGSPPLATAPFSAEDAAHLQGAWAGHECVEMGITNSLGMELRLLPPGEFTMGRTQESYDEIMAWIEKDPDMKKHKGGMVAWSMLMMPAHSVRITKPFYMGAHEVTVGQFRKFAEASGYKTEAERGLNHGQPYKGRRKMSTWRNPMAWRKGYVQKEDEPVLHLGWVDCVAFCEWLSKEEGREYTLPTEAQWEYACRAGTTTPWHFGGLEDVEKVAHEYAYWSDGAQSKHPVPRPVGKGKPNAFGLYDMHGNVWEYVADWWHRLSYKDAPLNDPTGHELPSEKGDFRRIIRGSSFDWGRWGGDSAYRMRITQHSNQHPHMGFRVALRIDGAKGAPLAKDPDKTIRAKTRDPGRCSEEVEAALARGKEGKGHPATLQVDVGGGVKMDFVLIQPGTFLMGSNQGSKDEQPVHRVVISKPFYMAKHELTQAQWMAVMGKDKRIASYESPKNDMTGPMKAMNGLSWDMCQQYIRKLKGKLPGRAFSLPTEAQWEYACRAGVDTEYSFGDDASQIGKYAWYQGNAVWPKMPAFEGRTAYPTTGVKIPNAWGLHDMHGGVWEWCQDRYSEDYYLHAPLVDPAGPGEGMLRVMRGGSWFRYAKYARSAYRRFFHPESDSDAVTAWVLDFGCRLVINLEAGGLTKKARSLQRKGGQPVLKVGPEGAWDDQTLGCFSVVDAGNRFLLYTGGTQFGQKKKIGMASSGNGTDWKKDTSNPLFPGSMPYVLKAGGGYRMYHPGKDASGKHGLLMRASKDGKQWGNPRLVLAGNVLDPCVLQVAGGGFHLYYCSGGKKKKDGKTVWEFQNRAATSPDGIHWEKSPRPILPLGPEGSWDTISHAGPCVLELADGFHLWYLGSGEINGKTAWRIGHAQSKGGLTWKKTGESPVLDIGKPGAWDGGTFLSFDIVERNGQLLFWYAAAPTGHGDETKMKIQIGHGSSAL